MSTQKRDLSSLMESYLAYRAPRKAANTLRCDRRTLGWLITIIGNIQAGNLQPHHLETYFMKRGETCQNVTLNLERSTLSAFFKWCRAHGHIPVNRDLLATVESLPVMDRERTLIPPAKFDTLLDAAPHPRDRVVVALGLYALLRQGEVSLLRVRDVNLDSGELAITRPKVHQRDVLPIVGELDRELRRWLTFYSENGAGVDPEYYLAPAKSPGNFYYVDGVRHRTEPTLRPTVMQRDAFRSVQYALRAAGYGTDQEGGHTLRRSGARALFDLLVSEGYDGAMRTVQAMLGHKSITMTEHYLGLSLDRAARNKQLKGRMLYAVQGSVVKLKTVSEST